MSVLILALSFEQILHVYLIIYGRWSCVYIAHTKEIHIHILLEVNSIETLKHKLLELIEKDFIEIKEKEMHER